MALFRCGDPLRYGTYASGSSGCLVRFLAQPDRLLMLTAGHVVLPTFAKQGDAIYVDSTQGNQMLGRLLTWTTVDGNPTTDAALIWVFPDQVDPSLGNLGPPTGEATATVGLRVQTATHPLQNNASDPTVADPNQDIPDVVVLGPDWPTPPSITYRSQITTDHHFTHGGDSGSMAVDDSRRVIGMVVGGSDSSGGFTMITPISALLDAASWGGMALELVMVVDSQYVAPPAVWPTAAPPQLAASASLSMATISNVTAPVTTIDGQVLRSITTAVRLNEIGNQSPYQISFAGKGSSGASFGFMQGDLAAGQPGVSQTFLAVLASAGVADNQASTLLTALSRHLLQNPLSSSDTQLIDDALNSPVGRALVDKMDQSVLSGVCSDVNRCLQAATTSHRTVDLKATLYMSMWINMTGPPTKMLSWVGGGLVTLGKVTVGPAPMRIDGNAMEEFLGAMPYFLANPRNFSHLCQCAASAMGSF